MSKQPTPIAFTTDKNGRTIAYRSGGYQQLFAWFRIGLDEAKMRIATGAAIEVPYVVNTHLGTQSRPAAPVAPVLRLIPGGRS